MKTSANMVCVWDPLVRIGHWTLVVAFFTAYFTDDDLLTQHVWAGYVVGIVIAIRVLWGFVGTEHARFGDFVKSPTTVLKYLGDLMAHRAKRYVGHNPAGGAMILVLLVGLTGTVLSGLVLYAIEENSGPLAEWIVESPSPFSPISVADADEAEAEREHYDDDEALEELWEEIHEVFSNLTLLFVGFHVAGVLYSSYAEKENLILAMVTGRKRRGPN